MDEWETEVEDGRANKGEYREREREKVRGGEVE